MPPTRWLATPSREKGREGEGEGGKEGKGGRESEGGRERAGGRGKEGGSGSLREGGRGREGGPSPGPKPYSKCSKTEEVGCSC